MKRTIVELLAAKRDGLPLEAHEIKDLISLYMKNEVADYQLAAFLMASYLRGLNEDETVALTEAMLHSGQIMDLSSISGIKVDKHSTGGVGDKVSICLAPLVAACGVFVPMVSGRGLGHTGGTLDKLEAIPGFNVHLDHRDFVRITRDIGVSLIGQTGDIAPADKRIYALRDVTATVECIPLIVASILSKKLAEGIDALVLDVKVGSGAFMKNEAQARKLASALVHVGTKAGKQVVARLTRMDTPLGLAVGNANETREALEVLHPDIRSPADLVECTFALGAEMLILGKKAADETEARYLMEQAIKSGKALEKMEHLVAAHGGDAEVVRRPSKLATAKRKVEIKAQRVGFVGAMDSFEIGLTCVNMGAGRTRADQHVDHGVGIDLVKKTGDFVEPGEVLAILSLRDHHDAEALSKRVYHAYTWSDVAPKMSALIMERISS